MYLRGTTRDMAFNLIRSSSIRYLILRTDKIINVWVAPRQCRKSRSKDNFCSRLKYHTTPGIFEKMRCSLICLCELCNATLGGYFKQMLWAFFLWLYLVYAMHVSLILCLFIAVFNIFFLTLHFSATYSETWPQISQWILSVFEYKHCIYLHCSTTV